MKTKKIRLRFNDLFNNRIIYMAEPGMPVVEAKVLGHFNSTVSAMGLHFSESEGKPTWSSDHGDYDILPYSEELMVELGIPGAKPSCANPRWVVVTMYHFPNKVVKLGIVNKQGILKTHEFQESYFDPNECHMRAFKTRKLAERYSELYADHIPGTGPLESIFG